MENKQKHRTVVFYKDHFKEFFRTQRTKVRDKILWTIKLIEGIGRVPETYLKHIENTEGLFEIRVQVAGDIFRIFCFFDRGRLVVLANGFHKKTQKHLNKKFKKH